jgi:hypothetical protein
MKQRILAELSRHPSRTRKEGQRRLVVSYLVAVLGCLVVFQAAGGVGHSAGRPLYYTLLIALGSGAVALLVSRFVLFRSLAMFGRSSTTAWLIVAGVPLATLFWLGAWNGHYVEPMQRIGYRCLALSLSTGGILLGVALFLQKRTLAGSTGVIGAALGAACAAWGAIFVVLWCPLTNAPHACVGHVLPILLLSVVGAIVGFRVLGLRPV